MIINGYKKYIYILLFMLVLNFSLNAFAIVTETEVKSISSQEKVTATDQISELGTDNIINKFLTSIFGNDFSKKINEYVQNADKTIFGGLISKISSAIEKVFSDLLNSITKSFEVKPNVPNK